VYVFMNVEMDEVFGGVECFASAKDGVVCCLDF
jgi:hypothetical protein